MTRCSTSPHPNHHSKPQQQLPPISPPDIYKAASLRKWSQLRPSLTSSITGEVLTCSESAIDGCRYVDLDGWTALHKATFGNAPLDIVEALVYTYPPALNQPNRRGWTPLHLACWREGHQDVVLFLLSCAPKNAAALTTASGKTPLYCACACVRNTHYDVLNRLLRALPDALLQEDDGGRTPLQLVCLEYGPAIRRAVDEVTLADSCNVFVGDDEAVARSRAERAARLLAADKDLNDGWEKIALLIQGAHHHSQKQLKRGKDDRMTSASSPRGKSLRWPGRDTTKLQDRLVHAFAGVASMAMVREEKRKRSVSRSKVRFAIDESGEEKQWEQKQQQNLQQEDGPPLLPFLQFATLLHPHQLSEADGDGRTPVRIAFVGENENYPSSTNAPAPYLPTKQENCCSTLSPMSMSVSGAEKGRDGGSGSVVTFLESIIQCRHQQRRRSHPLPSKDCVPNRPKAVAA